MKACVYANQEKLAALVESAGSIGGFAEQIGVTRHTVRNALSGHAVSAGFVAGVIKVSKAAFADVFYIGAAAPDRLTA